MFFFQFLVLIPIYIHTFIHIAAKATIIFHLIHEILKPTSMKIEEIDNVRTKTKRTIDESISAFFHHSASIDLWNEYAASSNRSFQPIIGANSSIQNQTLFYSF